MGRVNKQSAVFVVLASAAAASCVLFVEPAQDLQGTCHFAGEDATCGSCLASACRTFVDQCCGDGLCRGEITEIDACAKAGGAACRNVAYPTSGAPAADALARCLLAECDKPCGSVSTVGPPGDTAPPPSTACTTPSDGKSCRCEVPSGTVTSNTTTCTSAVVPNSVCCADLDWPLGGTKCDCRTVTCATSNGGAGCTCTTFGTGPLTSCSTGGGCCQGSSSGCECGANPNLCSLVPTGTTGFASVPSCGPSTIGCGSRKRVGRCSAQ